jgi:thiazole/oxazole-forming peptide maturase SagD family component
MTAMESCQIYFGDALGGAENAALRARIEELVGVLDRPLVVDSVLALHQKLPGEKLTELSTASYLLFDLQSLFLFDESLDGPPLIDSAVRHIVDGYPSQPFDLLDQHFAERPFHSFFPLESLDLLPCLWTVRRPGSLTALSLTSGEIETAAVTLHPRSPWVSRLKAGTPAGLRLQAHSTDASLRSRAPQDLDDFVSRSSGIVRRQLTIWGYMSLPVGTTMMMWKKGHRKELCFGKGRREKSAAAIAICESLERFQIAFHRHDEELIYGSYPELAERALDPRHLFFGRSPQCPEDSLPVYDEQLPIYWTRAHSPWGDETLVPAQEIWFSVQEIPGEHLFIEQTTSGCALGGCTEEAAVFAILEALERDAYLTMWYLRRPCPEIDPDSIRNEGFQILRRRWELEFHDYSLHLFDITTDTAVPAVAAIAVRHRGDGPKTFQGAAVRLCAERACLVALEDVASFSRHMDASRLSRSRHLLAHPEDIRDPADHGAVYAADEPFERLGFLDFTGKARIRVRDVGRGAVIPAAELYDLREVIERLARHLETCGVKIYLKDITHPAVAERGLRCVKAITPGLYPLWFGHRQRRFDITPRLDRLSLTSARHSSGEVPQFNLEVHPFV